MERPYFCAYHSYLEELEQLTDSEKGRLFVACLTYIITGEVPQLRGNERFVFPVMKKRIDEDKQRFAELDRKQAENGRKGGRPRKKPQEAADGKQSSEKPKKPMGFSENPKNPRVFTNSEETHGFSQFAAGAVKENRKIFDDSELYANTETHGFSQNTSISQKPMGFSENNAGLNNIAAIEEIKKKIAAKAATKEKTKNPPDGGLPLPPPSEGECPHPSPEATWLELGLGQRIGKALKDMLDEFRQAGISDTVIAAAMREAAEYEAKAPLPYVRRILEQCQAYGIFTAQDWKDSHKGNRGSKRVDRATPSGNDFLADALSRPRRHKRTG